VKFIEQNWGLPALGNGAADAASGPLMSMLEFHGDHDTSKLFLDPSTGEPVKN
jgi:hypothetical protein